MQAHIRRFTAFTVFVMLNLPVGAPATASDTSVTFGMCAPTSPLPCPQNPHPSSFREGASFLCHWEAKYLARVTITFLGATRSISAESIQSASGSGSAAYLLLAIPLHHAAAAENLSWTAYDTAGRQLDQRSMAISIQKGIYPEQHLTLQQKFVTPDPALNERIKQERILMRNALNSVSPVRSWSLPMERPVPGSISSRFGLKRVLNKQPRAPHTGLDFRAAAGDPINAVAKGKVILTGDFYYAGNCAVVDHGLGVTSAYMHMSKIYVQEGQLVAGGEPIGAVGSTGRSTGPHLHLGMAVHGIMTDPFSFIPQKPGDIVNLAPPPKTPRKSHTTSTSERNSHGPNKKTQF